MNTENFKEIIAHNREQIYHLSKKTYPNLYELFRTSIRHTLFQIYKFISDKQVILKRNQYLFFADTKSITYKIRKRYGVATSNRHINYLCALGFLKKISQKRNTEELLEVNKSFFSKYPSRKRAIGVYALKRLTKQRLRMAEHRAMLMLSQGIRPTTISNDNLIIHGLEDIAKEVYIANSKATTKEKLSNYAELKGVIELCISENGYCTKQHIMDNLTISDKKITQLMQIFKHEIKQDYLYGRPTKEEKKAFNLTSNKFILRRKKHEKDL